MKKALFSALFISLLFSSQVTSGTPLGGDPEPLYIITQSPVIPLIQAGANKPISEQIAFFGYDLPEGGQIASASIQFAWSGKKIHKISQLSLDLDDISVIDFGEYYGGLDKAGKKSLKRALRQNGWINFDLDFTEGDFGDLRDEEAYLNLQGKSKFFKNLYLSDVTLTIADPVSEGPSGIIPPVDGGLPPDDGTHSIINPGDGGSSSDATAAVPEPATLLLLGSGLLGLAVCGRKKFLKK